MSTAKKKRSIRDKVQSWRERMRSRGLRPIQIWVPDTRTARFRTEAHRQSVAVANSTQASEDQDFVDAVSDRDGR